MKKQSIGLTVFVIAVFVLFGAVLLIPQSREVFKALSGGHPYLMGFAKFALLATAGELIASAMKHGQMAKPPYLAARFLIWGVIGVWITYMMKVFYAGTGALMESGMLPGKSTLLHAFYTAATMNLTFGPTFMAVHKCSDTYLQLRSQQKKVTLKQVIQAVDWHGFVSFTVLKTVPLFWIPAHTVTFLLPAEYQVMLAAFLSVALGVLLNLGKKQKAKN